MMYHHNNLEESLKVSFITISKLVLCLMTALFSDSEFPTSRYRPYDPDTVKVSKVNFSKHCYHLCIVLLTL